MYVCTYCFFTIIVDPLVDHDLLGSIDDLEGYQMIEEKQLDNSSFPTKQQDVRTEEVTMTITQLHRTASQLRQYSLRDIGMRKIRQLQSRVSDFDEGEGLQSLSRSRIIDSSSSSLTDLSDARSLYFCLPFFSQPPRLQMLFSTDLHSHNISSLYSKTELHKGSSIILIKSNQFCFGAFVSHPIVKSNKWSGSNIIFLINCCYSL